ncbi:sensor histidine kinase [Sphingobacterium pedocola]|uniref:histidine kinase n=1 Tax=Sphingobacterium pedocola TaxID=2082722 RepID=A0ABR9TBT0_9SPHI|nr:ATP-binding protein [Sphingobacterium pedocola]MBE8722524.1 hypothetical protein [Sphingobacterium pedocola]
MDDSSMDDNIKSLPEASPVMRHEEIHSEAVYDLNAESFGSFLKFLDLFTIGPLGYMLINRSAKIVYLNKRGREILGVQSEDILGSSLYGGLYSASIKALNDILQKQQENTLFSVKLRVNYPGSTQEYLYFYIKKIRIADNEDLYVLLFSTVSVFASEVDVEVNFMEAIIDAQDREREQLGSILHDSLAQVLYGIRLSLQHFLMKNPEFKSNIQPIKSMLDESIHQIRDLSKDLAPSVLRDFGLKKAVMDMVKRIHVPQLEIHTHIEDDIQLPYEYEFGVFRIIQELLNNCLKHSNASEIWIRLFRKDENLIMEVKDNGQGFLNGVDECMLKGTGLRNIKNRVEVMKGTLSIDYDGSGCVVKVVFKNKGK